MFVILKNCCDTCSCSINHIIPQTPFNLRPPFFILAVADKLTWV